MLFWSNPNMILWKLSHENFEKGKYIGHCYYNIKITINLYYEIIINDTKWDN